MTNIAAKSQPDITVEAHRNTERPWPSPGYAWYVVVLLNLAYVVSFIDRGILSLLVQPIKAALNLSDTQIGLVQGTAFGLFFTLMAVPFGWLADSANRMRLVGCGVALWSFMTASCGLAGNFVHLFFARMGVGIGEATLSPSAPSLLADYFPPARRTLPLSLYIMAAGIGGGLSLLAGGFVSSLIAGRDHVTLPILGSFAPWQVIFFAVGLPGLVVSVLFFLAREPARRDHGEPQGTFKEFLRVVADRRGILIPHFAGYCVFQIYAYGLTAWIPAYYIRVHGWTIPEVGYRFGVLQLLCATPGGLVGGWLARWLWDRGRREANLLTSAIVLGAQTVPAVACTLTNSGMTSLYIMVLVIILANAPGGASVAAIQEIVPNRVRGRVTAIYYAMLSLVGISTGPLVVGLLNDHLFHDEASVGKSLSLLAVLMLPPSSALLLLASRKRRQFTESA